MRNEVLRMLPQTVQIALTGIPDAQIEELRLRVGQKPAVLYAGGERPLSVRTVLLQKELQQTLLNASAQSQYAVQEQLRSGYLSLSGGYRLGVCGSAVVQNGCMTGLREISSLALRVPHDIRHPPERLLPYLQESCLLAGAPGSGKTTLLRSCIRALSENRQRVAVVDERLELAGAVHGVPQFDLGPCTDVLSGGRGDADAAARHEPAMACGRRDHAAGGPCGDPAGGRLRRQAACDDPRRFC